MEGIGVNCPLDDNPFSLTNISGILALNIFGPNNKGKVNARQNSVFSPQKHIRIIHVGVGIFLFCSLDGMAGIPALGAHGN
jgi:hypothetical protein